MAKKDTSKQWFLTGYYPTQAQFAQVFDWLRWKDEPLEISEVNGLQDAINDAGNSGGGNATVWGNITGNLKDQADLKAALDALKPVPIIVIECVTDNVPVVTGSTATVTGITAGSLSVVCAGFKGLRVRMFRGNLHMPGLDPQDGSYFFTKDISSDIITLNAALIAGEFIHIETIN